MSDEQFEDLDDEEEEEDELEITIDNLTQAVTNDFFSTAKEAEKIAEAVKADLENFIKPKGNKHLNEPVEIPSEEYDLDAAAIPRVSGYDIIKTSLHKMHDKALLDFRIIRLFDEYMTKEKERFIREEYVQKYFTLLPKMFNDDFELISRTTNDKVNTIKSQLNFEDATKDVRRDFALVNSGIKQEVELTKRNIKEMCGPYTVSLVPPSPEELESESFVKEELFQVTHQIRDDILASKELNDGLIEETKNSINTFVDGIQGTIMNGRSFENVNTIRASVTTLRTKINAALLENTKTIPELITLNALNFMEKDQRIKEIWQCIVDSAVQLRKDLWAKKIEMRDEVDCILRDIIKVAEDIRNRMNMNEIKKSMTQIDSIKNEHVVNIKVDLDIERKIIEVQEDVQKLKRILQNRFDDIRTNATANKIDTPDVDVAAAILTMLESVTENCLKSFRWTEDKMNRDMELIKSKLADPEINPIAALSFDELKSNYLQTFKKTDAKLTKDVKMIKSNVKKQLEHMVKRLPPRQDNQNSMDIAETPSIDED